MAGSDRTEKATPKRRQEARKKGQVARSTDLNGSIVLVAGLLAISALAPKVFSTLQDSLRESLSRIAHPDLTSPGALSDVLRSALETFALAAAPIALVCLFAGVGANLAQVRLRFSPSALKPDFKRINPVSGFKNLFGANALVETLKSIVKVVVVGALVALAVVPNLRQLGATMGMDPAALGAMLGHSILGVAQRAAIAYLLIGLADFFWQRRRHEKQLRMTKEEVKEEHKQHDLPREVKTAMRRRQMQAARARMMAAVPEADVVVTNPTHFAVALSYDGTKPAPEVVAKGQDLVAAQIRKLAEENDVPIVEDPPLARALHRDVEIGRQIPEDFYQAVAQLLAYVYRVARRRRRSVA